MTNKTVYPTGYGLIAKHNAALAKIHLAKKQLGLDDDTYRALLQQVAGVQSSKDLTDAGIDKVLTHFRQAGAVFTNDKKAGKKPHTMNRPDTVANQLKKIEALMTDMELPWDYLIARQDGSQPENTGTVADGSSTSATPGSRKTKSMLERLTGKQRLEWCNGEELSKVIAALAVHQRKLSAKTKAQEAVE